MEFLNRGQKYEAVGTVPYRTADGRLIELTVLESHCATCGELFRFKTSRTTFMSRRCRLHARPGVSVERERIGVKPKPTPRPKAEPKPAADSKAEMSAWRAARAEENRVYQERKDALKAKVAKIRADRKEFMRQGVKGVR